MRWNVQILLLVSYTIYSFRTCILIKAPDSTLRQINRFTLNIVSLNSQCVFIREFYEMECRVLSHV